MLAGKSTPLKFLKTPYDTTRQNQSQLTSDFHETCQIPASAMFSISGSLATLSILAVFTFAPNSAYFDYLNYANNLESKTCNPDDLDMFPDTRVLVQLEACSPYGLCYELDCVDACAGGFVRIGSVCGFYGQCEMEGGGPVCMDACGLDPEVDPGWLSVSMAEAVNQPCGALGDCVERECVDHCGGVPVGSKCGYFGICSDQGKCEERCDTGNDYTPNYWFKNLFPVCGRSEEGITRFSRRGVCIEGFCIDPCRLEDFEVRKPFQTEKSETSLVPDHRSLRPHRLLPTRIMHGPLCFTN